MPPHPAFARPDPNEYPADFGKYVNLSPEGDIKTFLDQQRCGMRRLLESVSEADSHARNPPYTWSIRQVVGHITDCERVFGHRALWIARRAEAPLESFDEQGFMDAANFDRCPFAELLAEFEHVRQSHLSLFRLLAPEAWLRRGTVLGRSATARTFAWVIAGHTQHHLDILRRRLNAS